MAAAGDVIARELAAFAVSAESGSRHNPLDEDWQLAKFRANAELALTPAAAQQLSDALLAIDDAPALGPVLALAQAPKGLPARS
jgi:hypothetical protein